MSELPITPLDRVTAYRPLWSEYRRRYNRTEGLDSKLALEWGVVSGRMNELLEDLFSKNVVVLDAHEPYVKPVQNFGLGKAVLYEEVQHGTESD